MKFGRGTLDDMNHLKNIKGLIFFAILSYEVRDDINVDVFSKHLSFNETFKIIISNGLLS